MQASFPAVDGSALRDGAKDGGIESTLAGVVRANGGGQEQSRVEQGPYTVACLLLLLRMRGNARLYGARWQTKMQSRWRSG